MLKVEPEEAAQHVTDVWQERHGRRYVRRKGERWRRLVDSEEEEISRLTAFLSPGGQLGFRGFMREGLFRVIRVMWDLGYQPPGSLGMATEEQIKRDRRALREQHGVSAEYIGRFVERMDERPELERAYNDLAGAWIKAVGKREDYEEDLVRSADRVLSADGMGTMYDEDPETQFLFFEEMDLMGEPPRRLVRVRNS